MCFFGDSFACANEAGVTIHSPDGEQALAKDLTINLSVQDMVAIDGKLVTSHWNHCLRVWDLESKHILLEKQLSRSFHLVNTFALAGADLVVSEDESVLVLDLATGTTLREFEVGAFVTCTIAFDGKVAVAADRSLHVWDVARNTLLAVFAHDSEVVAAAALPCGSVVTGTKTGELSFWNVETGCRVRHVQLPLPQRSFSWTVEGVTEMLFVNANQLLVAFASALICFSFDGAIVKLDTPRHQLTCLALGPDGTAVAAFANGQVCFYQ